MRLETIPLILGILVCLLGIWFVADAWFHFGLIKPARERRRQKRSTLSSTAETCLGIGTFCLGFALISRDTGRFTNVAIFVGLAYFVAAIAMSYRYILDWITKRGESRRRPEHARTFVGPKTLKRKFKDAPYPASRPDDAPDLPETLDLTAPPPETPEL